MEKVKLYFQYFLVSCYCAQEPRMKKEILLHIFSQRKGALLMRIFQKWKQKAQTYCYCMQKSFDLCVTFIKVKWKSCLKAPCVLAHGKHYNWYLFETNSVTHIFVVRIIFEKIKGFSLVLVLWLWGFCVDYMQVESMWRRAKKDDEKNKKDELGSSFSR